MDFSHILIVFTWTPLESFMSVHLNRRVSVGAPDFRCKLVCFSQLHLFDFSLAGVHTRHQNVGAPYVLDCQSFQNFLKQSCQSCIKVVITGSDAELFFGFFKRLLQRSCHFPFAGFKRECQFVRTMRFWIYD